MLAILVYRCTYIVFLVGCSQYSSCAKTGEMSEYMYTQELKNVHVLMHKFMLVEIVLILIETVSYGRGWPEQTLLRGRGIKHRFVFLSFTYFVISKTHIVRELCGGECHFGSKALNITITEVLARVPTGPSSGSRLVLGSVSKGQEKHDRPRRLFRFHAPLDFMTWIISRSVRWVCRLCWDVK